jgi:predicted RNase H-like HicB family nuclease
MKSNDLILKCYAEQEEGVWVAVCLDFNLAAQADSYQEVKAKLESMISFYVNLSSG